MTDCSEGTYQSHHRQNDQLRITEVQTLATQFALIKMDKLTTDIKTHKSSHPSCARRHLYPNRKMARIKAIEVKDIETTMIVGPQFGMLPVVVALSVMVSVKESMM